MGSLGKRWIWAVRSWHNRDSNETSPCEIKVCENVLNVHLVYFNLYNKNMYFIIIFGWFVAFKRQPASISTIIHRWSNIMDQGWITIEFCFDFSNGINVNMAMSLQYLVKLSVLIHTSFVNFFITTIQNYWFHPPNVKTTADSAVFQLYFNTEGQTRSAGNTLITKEWEIWKEYMKFKVCCEKGGHGPSPLWHQC